MSIKLLSAAWDLEIGSTEKMVLMSLCDHANDSGTCWPSVPTICKKTSKGERTVQGALKWLEAEGYFTRSNRDGTSCVFHLDPRKICAPAEIAPPQKLRQPPQDLRPTPAESAPKPSMNRKEPSKVDRRARDQFVLPDWIPAEPWDGFVAMRKEIGHRLTERGMKLAVAALDKLRAKGHDPGEVLDQSTMNNWRGLFEVKENGRTNSNRQNLTAPNGRPMGRTEAATRAVLARVAGTSEPGGSHHGPHALPDHRRAIGYVP